MVCSTYNRPELLRRCYEAGVDLHLIRSAEMNDLQGVLREFHELHGGSLAAGMTADGRVWRDQAETDQKGNNTWSWLEFIQPLPAGAAGAGPATTGTRRRCGPAGPPGRSWSGMAWRRRPRAGA
jgi:hypothetical protein